MWLDVKRKCSTNILCMVVNHVGGVYKNESWTAHVQEENIEVT